MGRKTAMEKKGCCDMRFFLFDNMFKDTSNKQRVAEILEEVPNTDMIFPGQKTLDDAIKEIVELGETDLPKYLIADG